MVPRNATWLKAKAVEYASPIVCARDTACAAAATDCSRIAEEQECRGEKRQCINSVVSAEPSIRCDRFRVGSAQVEGSLQVNARVNESTHKMQTSGP